MEIIRVVTAESVRRTHDIGPLCCIHRTKNHTHTHTHTHTNASSHLAEPAALFSRKSDLPDTIVARTSGFVRGRWPKDGGYSPVEIPGAHTVHSVRRSFSSAPSIRSVVFFSCPTVEPSTIRRVSPATH